MRINPLAKPPGALPGESASAATAKGEKAAFDAFLKEAQEVAEGSDQERAVKDAAHQFESYFLSHLLKTMRETIPEGGIFQQGFGNDVYTEMLDQEYARILSEGGGIGLSQVLERQLTPAGAELPPSNPTEPIPNDDL